MISNHTWYSLISDLSKPGMKRVTDFLAASNVTEDIRLLLPLAGAERIFCAFPPTVFRVIATQSRGGEPREICGMKAKGKGENIFLSSSSDSVSKFGDAMANAPEICAPAWIVQPQYRNAELIDAGLSGSNTRKQPNF